MHEQQTQPTRPTDGQNQTTRPTDEQKPPTRPTDKLTSAPQTTSPPVFPSVLAALVLQTTAPQQASPKLYLFPEAAPESLRVAVTINRSAPPDASLASEQSPTITKTLAAITKHHPVMHHTQRPQKLLPLPH
ncbi:hypothetical protein IV203_000151 [Nitzschia inconspicua]|uniref:Uncharacterized protein n=1 Tax=Nitzschia inconspicua TaxID=303405 RepID=A0A9K3PPP0_9STRA|nr:hypothetical protein IV203_000151 [Nitzschia inconspicua]